MGSLPRESTFSTQRAAISTYRATEKSSSGSATSSMWWGTPPISSRVGLAVPMSMRRYICMESADTTSPLWALASSTASQVLPEAVGPVITRIFGVIPFSSL